VLNLESAPRLRDLSWEQIDRDLLVTARVGTGPEPPGAAAAAR